MTLQLQAQKLEASLDIRDRKYKFKTYRRCFIGSDAINVMISLNLASNEKEAMELGNKLIQSNIIQHVTKKHAFKNEKLFYRYTDQYYQTDSYKSTLDQLNLLPSPNILFNDINSFITNIQSLNKYVISFRLQCNVICNFVALIIVKTNFQGIFDGMDQIRTI